jgi:hypothetical protein
MSELLELDDVLESAPPAASTAEVGDILQRRFELSGPVRALSSERDANFRVDTSAGPYLLKITNAAEDPQEVLKVLQGYAIEAVKIPLSGSVAGFAGYIGALLTRQDISTILQCGPSRRGRTGPTRGDR